MRPLFSKLFILLVMLGLAAFSAAAKVRLPGVFADHMVLQRAAVVPVWGWADAGEKISVAFAGQIKTTIADADGRWLVKLDALPASAESRSLTVIGNAASVRISDVLAGDV